MEKKYVRSYRRKTDEAQTDWKNEKDSADNSTGSDFDFIDFEYCSSFPGDSSESIGRTAEYDSERCGLI